MQTNYPKLFIFFFCVCLFISQATYSQKLSSQLHRADSLYAKGAYLKSLTIYRQILEKDREYSPQMLLKMAYMEEALHRYANSMYYLNLYYNLHPSRSVLRKMEEVARTQGLTGYEYRDSDFFLTQFKKYYLKLLEAMLIVAVAITTFMILKRRNSFFSSTFTRVAFLGFLGFLLYYINLLTFRQFGISQKPQAAVMADPAAGSKWLANLSAGNRLTITGEHDIWYEVYWKNQKAYIRKQNLRLLPD